MSATFTATTMARNAAEAIERVTSRLVDGFAVTGQVAIRSERHLLWSVEVANQGGNKNDCWVVLTSYGISPSPALGSMWEAKLGASA